MSATGLNAAALHDRRERPQRQADVTAAAGAARRVRLMKMALWLVLGVCFWYSCRTICR